MLNIKGGTGVIDPGEDGNEIEDVLPPDSPPVNCQVKVPLKGATVKVRFVNFLLP